MGHLRFPERPQFPEQEGDLCRELLPGGIGAAELFDQLRDDGASFLRADSSVLVAILDRDQEIGVQIASGAQAAVADVATSQISVPPE